MLIRIRGWGMALLAAGSMWPVSIGHAQDPSNVDPLPTVDPPAAVPQVRDDTPLSIEERVIRRNRNRMKNERIEDGDHFKKHPPVWSLKDVTKDSHPYAHPSTPAPGDGRYPSGPTGQFGQPYYYTATSPDTSGTGGGSGFGGGPIPMSGYGSPIGPAMNPGAYPLAGGYPGVGGPVTAPGLAGPGYAAQGYPAPGIGGYSYDAGLGYGGAYAPAMGGAGYAGGYGYGGASYAAQPGMLPGNPYLYHFGPGFYRYQEAGHYTFPYHSYRRPWYFHGHPSYNRDTNIPW